MFVSGVDWSGDPGNPMKPGASKTLVMAIVTIRIEALPDLESRFRDTRKTLGWSQETPFHFIDSDDRSRSLFFETMGSAAVHVTARIVDKARWFEERPRDRPADLLNDVLVDLLCLVPGEHVAGRIVQIDRPRSESAMLRDSQSLIRRALAAKGVRPGPVLKAVPDHRPDAYLVQIADMAAGGLVAWGAGDRRLRGFGAGLVVFGP